MRVAIALFTRDLRVHDNPVLHAACHAATQVVPLFVLDTAILTGGSMSANRAAFLAEALADLDTQLRDRQGCLVVRSGSVVKEVERIVADLGVTEVHLAADASGYSHRREQALRARLAGQGCQLRVHANTITIVEPGAITPSGGGVHFAVFTPYYRRWAAADTRSPLTSPGRITMPPVASEPLPSPEEMCSGQPSPHLPRGGETVGRHILRDWLAGPIHRYEHAHDDLAADGTSRLSPYLHFGCVSPTEALRVADRSTAGGEAFSRQLAWRDFHHQVLAARPDTTTADYHTRHDRWRRDDAAARAWRNGRTGYPIVDAGMRQLHAEGWMHNRARLITASFLTKTLYLDWRIGAQHFLDLLVDADVANNQLNWQWVAGTGTDSRPNRILNPLRQAERYDASGDYVRRYLPELQDIPGPAVHQPWKLDPRHRARLDYPDPIIDLRDGADYFRTARDNTSNVARVVPGGEQ
ncbi:MAG TPA: deoxyribodipyrimidine photo-lyase [Pseudonocardiaceae bacterium]|jgi:deoxyribodipyrimidine photo-lyase|nr:deoxyribodipyrimidine photo-lyase [Pseudonocardiaceae bacterium]